MGIKVALHHKTVYQYDRLVTLSPQVVRLRPAPHCRTSIPSYSLKVEPKDHFLNWQQDPQGNFQARLVFLNQTREFSVEVDLTADMTVINPFDFFLEPDAEKFPFKYEGALERELRPFLEPGPTGPLLDELVKQKPGHGERTIDYLVDLNQTIHKAVRYLIRMEPGVQSPEETLTLASGSCRDSAWLFVELLRRVGLAARFVSGYLLQLKPDVKPLEGPEGPTEDFTDLHAWAEVYLPGAGWVGLDPTSGLFAGEGHIPLAVAPEPQSAAPISGLVSECEVEFHHEMTVTRIHEDPRVTKPYTEEQWTEILETGDHIERDLQANDVRLTMGGEPTFVSMDDMDGEEWNTAALGPNKLRMAGDLIFRLRDKFAPGGLLHFGHGKWYPGESLPRWAITCYWRTDGHLLWSDPKWAARLDHNYGFGTTEAQLFAEELSRRLTLDPEHVIAAYEDPLEYIHKERQLPINVDPEKNKLDDPEERERLARVFSRGLGTPTGFVLPIIRAVGKHGPEWQTGLWMLRARHLFLIPGDSPVGLRLPLQSLAWEPVAMRQQVWIPDPFRPMGDLPVPERKYEAMAVRRQASLDSAAKERRTDSVRREEAIHPGVVRTALTVEARQGRLFVFLPPLESAADFIDLAAAIEDTAAKLEMPVAVEGYTPPHDSRIKNIKVTPDPGVIEVNIHPAANWRELVENTTVLYEQARQSRLATEKFMLDGRHTGTGGGNHVVLGGAHPADSPFLRRPDLLKSFIGYWLNHPSLSYLFSGMFVGPTSQAPRVDETRADSVYELEIAFHQLQGKAEYLPAWQVDRIFRDILVDVTGNTHRAEFCIDKLYSPDSSTGRLGLLELRALEMPPHARMSLTQQLLIRALLAWFWKEPYEEKPIRWGTRLHDLFLLPHFVEKDFRSVLHDLNHAGYSFDPAWFAPHVEFRFPVYGTVMYEGIEVELRQAIEPWYVLGEEPGGGGTARFVDSSLERLQVRVRGLYDEKHTVTCNGQRLPLQPTGTHGEYVCGVRYRAWWPPRCLHPSIRVHTPLVFDVVDLRSRHAIGGCTYHVAHPGGRSYDTFAVNSNEAESRRKGRFFAFGHTPGFVSQDVASRREPELNPEFPATLDLRIQSASRRR